MAPINTSLFGRQVMILVSHDNADFFKKTTSYDRILKDDESARVLLDYISGKKANIPVFSTDNGPYDQFIPNNLTVPASQLPQL